MHVVFTDRMVQSTIRRAATYTLDLGSLYLQQLIIYMRRIRKKSLRVIYMLKASHRFHPLAVSHMHCIYASF
jgi:hypothetical protein